MIVLNVPSGHPLTYDRNGIGCVSVLDISPDTSEEVEVKGIYPTAERALEYIEAWVSEGEGLVTTVLHESDGIIVLVNGYRNYRIVSTTFRM